ncbi:MAG: PepSY1/2 domain-containing protein [Eubacteriales bacterium]
MSTRKTKRIIIRLSAYCTVFFLLAVGFGLKYIEARDSGRLYRKINDERAYASLCGYMTSIGSILRQINEEQTDKLIGLSAEFSSLSGGSKAILASLPFNKSGRERLQTFFTESDFYVRSLAYAASTESTTVNTDINTIAEYIAYTDKIAGKLIAAYDRSDIQVSLDQKLKELQIDTPPSFGSDLFDSEYVSADFNITEKQAKKKARSYLGEYITLRRVESDDRYFRYVSGSSFADILRSGGALIRLSSVRLCSAEKIKLTSAEAKNCADTFLTNADITDIRIVSESVYAGRYEAEYAPVSGDQNNKLIYIGVSLDTGKITYFDASNYYNIK